GTSGDDPSRIWTAPLAGAVGPACRLRRRYAHAPAAALLTGLGAGEWAPLRSAHTPIFDAGTFAYVMRRENRLRRNRYSHVLWLHRGRRNGASMFCGLRPFASLVRQRAS